MFGLPAGCIWSGVPSLIMSSECIWGKFLFWRWHWGRVFCRTGDGAYWLFSEEQGEAAAPDLWGEGDRTAVCGRPTSLPSSVSACWADLQAQVIFRSFVKIKFSVCVVCAVRVLYAVCKYVDSASVCTFLEVKGCLSSSIFLISDRSSYWTWSWPTSPRNPPVSMSLVPSPEATHT